MVLVSAFGRVHERYQGVVTLLWRSVKYAHGYKIKYGLSPDNLPLTVDAGNVSGFRLTGLMKDKKYYFRIFAYNGSGESALSDVMEATTINQRPVAPHQVRVSENKSNGKLTVKWNKSLDYDYNARYNVYRSEDPYVGYRKVGSNVTGTSFTDQAGGLASNQKYFYTVKAVNEKGESFYPSNKNTIYKTVSTVGLNNVYDSMSGVHVYPNPAKLFIQVNLSNQHTNARYTFNSTTGKQVMSGSLVHQQKIDLSTVGSGIYILKITSAQGELQAKIMVE